MSWEHINQEKRVAGAHKSNIIRREKRKKLVEEYDKNPKICAHCHIKLEYTKRKNNFCSRSCAASVTNFGRIISEKHRKSTSDALKLAHAENRAFNSGKEKIEIVCGSCKKVFTTLPCHSARKYCSRECSVIDSPNNLKGKAGGYREGSGRAKSGRYKGIYCGSTYELCWVIYALDHNIEFSRFPTTLVGEDGLKYIPDFLLADGKTIIECKGYEYPGAVDKKTALAESLGYTVMVLRKEDLQHAFEYVKNTYGTSKFYTLYEHSQL